MQKNATTLISMLAHRCSQRWLLPKDSANLELTKTSGPDIRAITAEDSSLIDKALPAFQKYAEEQLAVATLPRKGQKVG